MSTIKLLELNADSSTSLAVSWRNSTSLNNETATGYLLLYGASNCSLQNNSSGSVLFGNLTLNDTGVIQINESVFKYVITSLEKWTCYQVKIRAIFANTSVSDSFSEILYARTKEDGEQFYDT